MIRFSRTVLLAAILMLAFMVGAAGIAGAAGTRWGVPDGELGNGFNPPRHYGEDVLQDRGTVIRALHRGCVFRVDNNVQGYEQEITVRYEPKGDMDQRWVLYGHVLQDSQRREGSCFNRGDVLARIGTRTDSLGSTPHAHVQVWKTRADAAGYNNGKAINPAPVRQNYGEL